MKKLFILFSALVVGLHSFALPVEVDQKFLKSFDSSFPDARDVSWTEYPEAYEVYFIQGGIASRVFYPKDHSFVRITRYYKEESLPYQVRFLVNKEFPGKKVFGVTEVATVSPVENNLSTTYSIILEDAAHWFIITLNSNGSLTVGKVLKKSL